MLPALLLLLLPPGESWGGEVCRSVTFTPCWGLSLKRLLCSLPRASVTTALAKTHRQRGQVNGSEYLFPVSVWLQCLGVRVYLPFSACEWMELISRSPLGVVVVVLFLFCAADFFHWDGCFAQVISWGGVDNLIVVVAPPSFVS